VEHSAVILYHHAIYAFAQKKQKPLIRQAGSAEAFEGYLPLAEIIANPIRLQIQGPSKIQQSYIQHNVILSIVLLAILKIQNQTFIAPLLLC